MTDEETTIRLPLMADLLPVQCHPAQCELEAEGIAWARRNLRFTCDSDDDLAVILDSRLALWECLILPKIDADLMRKLCQLIHWLFTLDTAILKERGFDTDSGEATRKMRDIIAVVRGARGEHNNPFGHLLEKLRGHIWAGMPDKQRLRFESALVGLLEGFLEETAASIQGSIFDFDYYLTIRRKTIGCDFHFILAEYGNELDLTDQFAEDPRWLLLHETALNHCVLVNDLFSARKEYMDGEPANAVLIIRQCDGIDVQEAVNTVCRLIDQYEHEFIVRRDTILADSSDRNPAVTTYLTALGLFLAGNRRWSYITPRYHGIGHVWSGQTSGELVLLPDRTVFRQP